MFVAEEIGLADGADEDINLGSEPGISTAPIDKHPSNPCELCEDESSLTLLLYLFPLGGGIGTDPLIAIGIVAEGGTDIVKSSGGTDIAISVDGDGDDVINGDPEVDPGNEDEVTDDLNQGEFPMLTARLFPLPTLPNRVRIPIELPTDRVPLIIL